MFRTRTLGFALAFVVAAAIVVRADYLIPVPTAGLHAFTCVVGGISEQCPAHVNINSNGAETAIPSNPLFTSAFRAFVSAQAGNSGYQQISSLSSATPLAVPTDATIAEICVEVQGVRYLDTGSAPTASVGIPVYPTPQPSPAIPIPTCFPYAGPLSQMQLIQITPGAIVNIRYYKSN